LCRFLRQKIKTEKCLRNTNTSFPLILINSIRSDRFPFGPTDFHGLSDRMSDTFFFFNFREVCLNYRLMIILLIDHVTNKSHDLIEIKEKMLNDENLTPFTMYHYKLRPAHFSDALRLHPHGICL
jgi:hypothetical protein